MKRQMKAAQSAPSLDSLSKVLHRLAFWRNALHNGRLCDRLLQETNDNARDLLKDDVATFIRSTRSHVDRLRTIERIWRRATMKLLLLQALKDERNLESDEKEESPIDCVDALKFLHKNIESLLKEVEEIPEMEPLQEVLLKTVQCPEFERLSQERNSSPVRLAKNSECDSSHSGSYEERHRTRTVFSQTSENEKNKENSRNRSTADATEDEEDFNQRVSLQDDTRRRL